MKIALKTLALGVAIAASATLAHADPMISGGFNLSGNDTFTSNTFNLSNGQVGAFGATSGSKTGITGTFASYLTNGQAVTLATGNLPYAQGANTVTPPFNLFTVNENGESFSFFIQSYYATYTPAGQPQTGPYDDFSLLGLGYYTGIGFANTAGTFQINSQLDTTTGASSTTFAGSTDAIPSAVTPEPGSLVLLGTSLLGAAGIARRRFSAKFGRTTVA